MKIQQKNRQRILRVHRERITGRLNMKKCPALLIIRAYKENCTDAFCFSVQRWADYVFDNLLGRWGNRCICALLEGELIAITSVEDSLANISQDFKYTYLNINREVCKLSLQSNGEMV